MTAKRIVSTKTHLGGEHRFEGTCISVRMIANLVADGLKPPVIMDMYPGITVDDVWAAHDWANQQA